MPQLADLVVRQLVHSDAALIGDAFAALSIESRYLRYGAPIVDPAVALGWVEELDGLGNAAVGAMAPAPYQLVGCARYASVEDGAYAEIAVTVSDAWQGHGVGALLLAALVRHARRAGVGELRACVLPSNKRARQLLASQRGWRPGSRHDGFVEYVRANAG